MFSSNEGGSYDLYLCDEEGMNRKQLTFDPAGDEIEPAASPDGQYIVFSSDRAGERTLCRINRDGTGLKSLIAAKSQEGSNRNPFVTPDSRWSSTGSSTTVQPSGRCQSRGGAPTLVKGSGTGSEEEKALGASVSPDGHSLAFFRYALDRKKGWSPLEIAIGSLDGHIVKSFPYLETNSSYGDSWRVQWSRDGSALYYNLYKGTTNDIWKQPLSGGPPVQVTHSDEPVYDFDWSFSGQTLAYSRETTLSDVVLITNFH